MGYENNTAFCIWSTMIRGASYCAISGIILFALSINRFAHKDITS
jgi:ABC-2 type transport system permease protein